MKQSGRLLCCLFLLLSLCACGQMEKEDMISTEVAATEATEIENTEATTETPQKKEAAVVYFSVTGNTEEYAKMIAELTDADLFEIVPAKAYSEEDIDYNNDECRANKEMDDDSARPEIANDLSQVCDYETIYLGHPIWWGTAPRIIQTFMESYDLKGIKVYTFCTSGGSGIENSFSNLQRLYPDVNLISGKRLNGMSEDEVKEWIHGLLK